MGKRPPSIFRWNSGMARTQATWLGITNCEPQTSMLHLSFLSNFTFPSLFHQICFTINRSRYAPCVSN